MEQNLNNLDQQPKKKRPSFLRMVKHQFADLHEALDKKLQIPEEDNPPINILAIEQPK